jgi:hypothetical protein
MSDFRRTRAWVGSVGLRGAGIRRPQKARGGAGPAWVLLVLINA